MPFVKVKDATTDYGKPKDWDEERDGPCHNLWVRDSTYGRFGKKTFAWRPSAYELSVLNAGGVVEVHIVSNVMPPVAISVTSETDE